MKKNSKVMKWIIRYIENHLWFVEHTNAYVKGMPLKVRLRYPIAYVRFMFNAMKWNRKESVLRNTKRNNDSDSSNKSN
jgi:hypothetical protein